MPFVTQEHRDNPDTSIPGDLCYVYYKFMMEEWKNSPRWTTVDKILKNMIDDPHQRAEFLAFLVFFNIHVMPYEQMKREENGDIT